VTRLHPHLHHTQTLHHFLDLAPTPIQLHHLLLHLLDYRILPPLLALPPLKKNFDL
jgi:hypothetical protein